MGHLFYFGNDLIEVFFVEPPEDAGLNGFNGNVAWNIFFEAFHSRDSAVFKKELTGDFLAVMVVPYTDAAFFNQEQPLGGISLVQQHGFCRHFQTREKAFIGCPDLGIGGCVVFKLFEHALVIALGKYKQVIRKALTPGYPSDSLFSSSRVTSVSDAFNSVLFRL